MGRQKITLILGPGGLPGAAFEIGGLLALEEFLGQDILHVADEFQGSSCGAMIAFALMANFNTASLYSALYPDHPYYFKLSDLYALNYKEITQAALAFPCHLAKILGRLFTPDNVKLYERLAVPIQEMPLSGLFLTEGIEKYIERIIEDFKLPRFYGEFCKRTGKGLHLLTTDLSAGEPLILNSARFGHLELKKAIAASTSVAPLFRPVEVSNGAGKTHKLADGAYAMSLGIRHAYERGASLILYFNPLKPTRETRNVRNVFDIFEQLYRIPAHTRKRVAEQVHNARHPETLLGFEPDTDRMFHNLFRSDLRLDYADHGYFTALTQLHRQYTKVKRMFDQHGLPVIGRRRLHRLVQEFKPGQTLAAMRRPLPEVPGLQSGLFEQSTHVIRRFLSPNRPPIPHP